MGEKYFVARDKVYAEDGTVEFSRIGWGDLHNVGHPALDVELFVSRYLCYGDYDNSCEVERSNYRVFLEMFGSVDGVLEIIGGYDSHGIGLTPEALQNEEIQDILSHLENYPVIDEDDMSAITMEIEDECWKSYGEHDFQRVLETKFEIEDLSDLAHDGTLHDFYREMADKYNCYGHVESGGNYYFEIDTLIKKIDEKDFTKILLMV